MKNKLFKSKTKVIQIIKKLKGEKTFLEKIIHEKVSDLDFYNYFNFLDESKKVIKYLDITWFQYDELNTKIKELKRDLKGSK